MARRLRGSRGRGVGVASIVIIDKDRAAVEAVARALAARGHECKAYTEGKIALNDIIETPPGLLILDVMLEDISGFRLCRIVRGSTRLRTIPILVLSAMNNEEEVHHTMAQGADEFLTKPVDPSAVADRAQALLASHGETKGVDPLTKLADADGTKREIQCRIVKREKFGLVYVELLNLPSYVKIAGAESRGRVIRHLSRAITMWSTSFKSSAFFAGHMGMGHFLCVVPLDKVESYCRQVQQTWDDHLSDNAAALGLDAERRDGCLAVAFYAVRHVSDTPMTSQNLLEVLMRIRGSQPASSQAGIHLDRRAS